MKLLLKRRLKSLINYFAVLDEPTFILDSRLRPVFKNAAFKEIECDDFLEKVMEFLFSGKQPLDQYIIERQFIENYKVHTLIFQRKKGELNSVAMGKEFIANASHELRTPITIIKGFAETLLDMQDVSKEMLRSIIQKIVNSSYRMQSLVNNLLLLSDLDQTSYLKKTKLEVMPLVEKAIEELLLIYPEARVECFYANDPITMQANQELFVLALFNILQNAMKYSKKEPLIEVVVNRQEGGFFISIKDNGIGMAQSQLDRVFKRFITVNKSHSRKLGGAGLGLSLVDTIIKRHSGNISIESELDIGTQITFQFTN